MGGYLDDWLLCALQKRHLAHCPKATQPLLAIQTRISRLPAHFHSHMTISHQILQYFLKEALP